jgi:hypothetical protein
MSRLVVLWIALWLISPAVAWEGFGYWYAEMPTKGRESDAARAAMQAAGVKTLYHRQRRSLLLERFDVLVLQCTKTQWNAVDLALRSHNPTIVAAFSEAFMIEDMRFVVQGTLPGSERHTELNFGFSPNTEYDGMPLRRMVEFLSEMETHTRQSIRTLAQRREKREAPLSKAELKVSVLFNLEHKPRLTFDLKSE